MTREEFAQMKFRAGMTAIYKDCKYDIVSVNFEEDLLGLLELDGNIDNDLSWVRCENVSEIIYNN
jgi:hypothetical protein